MILSNASPLIAISTLSRLDILQVLFHQVTIPQSVYQEIAEHPRTPEAQRHHIRQAIADGVLEVRDVTRPHVFRRVSLGSGEQDVLRLALEHLPTILIMDDRQARNEAKDLGFGPALAFTTDVLQVAATRGLIDYDAILSVLKSHGVMLPEA